MITGAGGARIGSEDLELAFWSRNRKRGAGCDKPTSDEIFVSSWSKDKDRLRFVAPGAACTSSTTLAKFLLLRDSRLQRDA